MLKLETEGSEHYALLLPWLQINWPKPWLCTPNPGDSQCKSTGSHCHSWLWIHHDNSIFKVSWKPGRSVTAGERFLTWLSSGNKSREVFFLRSPGNILLVEWPREEESPSKHRSPKQWFLSFLPSGIIYVQHILNYPGFYEIQKYFVGQWILEMIEIVFSLLWLSVLSLSLELRWSFAAWLLVGRTNPWWPLHEVDIITLIFIEETDTEKFQKLCPRLLESRSSWSF